MYVGRLFFSRSFPFVIINPKIIQVFFYTYSYFIRKLFLIIYFLFRAITRILVIHSYQCLCFTCVRFKIFFSQYFRKKKRTILIFRTSIVQVSDDLEILELLLRLSCELYCHPRGRWGQVERLIYLFFTFYCITCPDLSNTMYIWYLKDYTNWINWLNCI